MSARGKVINQLKCYRDPDGKVEHGLPLGEALELADKIDGALAPSYLTAGEVGDLRHEIAELRDALNRSQASCDAQREANLSLLQKQAELERERDRARDQVIGLQKELQTVRGDLADARSDYQKAERERSAWQASVKQLQNKVERIADTLNSV